MDLRANMLSALDAHCAATGHAPSTVATKVVNDGKFFARVKAGKGFTVKRYEQVMAWFAAERERRNSVAPTTNPPATDAADPASAAA